MRRTAFIMLALVLALGVAVYVVARKPSTPPAPTPTWLTSLDPSRVSEIAVTWPGGEKATITPTFSPDIWTLNVGGVTRVVRRERVRGAVGLLAAIGSLPGEAGTITGATTVTITLAGGGPRTIEISGATLGGRTLVAIHEPNQSRPRLVFADASLASVFSPASVPAWAERSAFIALGDPDRVRVECLGAALALARRAGGWSVQQPVLARADSAGVTALVAGLHTLTWSREFVTPPPRADSGLDNPQFVARTETAIRVNEPGGVAVRTLVQQLRVGGPASADTVFAEVMAEWRESADTPNQHPALVWGPTVVILPRPGVEAITAAAGPVLGRYALDQPAADVRELWLGEADAIKPRLKAARGLNGWEHGAPARVLDTSAQRGIAALLALLCDQSAAAATLDVEGIVKPLGVVTVAVNGVEATRLQLGTAVLPLPTGAGEALVITDGPVHRLYPLGSHQAVVDWLREALRPEG